MRHSLAMVAVALFLLAPAAQSQTAGAADRTPPAPDPMVLKQRRQETVQQTDDLMLRIRKLNEAMEQQKASEALRAVGRGMQETCARLGQLQRRMAVHESKLEGDANRVRQGAVDRVQERLRVMARELEEAQQTVRYLSTMKQRQCDPLPADEAEQVRTRNQELAEHVVRINERVRTLQEWAAGKDAPSNAREAVRDVGQLHEQLRLMAESCDNMRNDTGLQGDRERLREMDRLHDRLHVMLRELEETTESLPQAFVG